MNGASSIILKVIQPTIKLIKLAIKSIPKYALCNNTAEKLQELSSSNKYKLL